MHTSPSQNNTDSRRKWLPIFVVAASLLFLLYKYVLQISPSIMVHPLMSTFHLNGLDMGGLTASWFWTMLVVQFAAGPILDRYPVRAISAFAILVSAIGAIAFAYTQNLHQAIYARSLMGAGCAFATVSYLKCTANWFSGRAYATVSGLLLTGVMLGSLLAQSPLSLLVKHDGWRHAMIICGFLGVIISLAYFLLIPSKKLTKRYQPHQVNQQSVRLSDCLSVLRSSQNWWLMAYSGLAFTPLAVFGGLWGNTCLETLHHLSPTTASMDTSFLFIGVGIGCPLFGWLVGKWFTRKNGMYIGLLMTFIGLSAALYLPFNSSYLIAFDLFVAGAGTGAFMLGFGIGKDINPLPLAATVVCLINTGDSLMGAITEPLVGRLLDITNHASVHAAVDHFSPESYYISMAVLPLLAVLAAMTLSRLKRTEPPEDIANCTP